MLDSSSIISGHTELYPATTFSDIWNNQQNLILHAAIYVPQRVREEVADREDAANSWLVQSAGYGFVASGDQTSRVEQRYHMLVPQFPRMVEGADLWVIAWALELDAFAVSQEAPNRPNRIPTVVQSLGGQAMTLSGLIRAEKWRFVNG